MLQIVFDMASCLFILLTTFAWAGRSIRHCLPADRVRPALLLFTASLLLKLTIILVWYDIVGCYELNESLQDSFSYDLAGRAIAFGLHALDFSAVNIEPEIFSHIVGLLYAIFGDHPIVVSFFNILLTQLLSIMLLQTCSSLKINKSVCFYVLCLVLFYPHFISGSYLLLKDVALSFLVVGTIWSLYTISNIKRKFVTSTVFLAIAFLMRPPMGIVLVALFAASFVFDSSIFESSYRLRSMAVRIVLAFFVLFVVAGIYEAVGGRSVEEVGYTLPTADRGGLVADDDYVRITSDGGGLAETFSIFVKNPIRLFRSILVTFIRVFYGPFFLYASAGPNLAPYGSREIGFRAVLECLGGVYTGLLMPFIVYGFFEFIRKERRKLLIWIFPIIWFFMMVLATPVIRWRLPIIPLVCIFAGLGLQSGKQIRIMWSAYLLGVIFLLAANASRYEGFYLAIAIIAGVAGFAAVTLFVSRKTVQS